MATPKSANERIRRKFRSKNKRSKNKSMSGRVVVKKSANNNPNRIKQMSESFVKFYKNNDVENPGQFKNLVNQLIDISIELSGKNSAFPFKLERLRELKEHIENN